MQPHSPPKNNEVGSERSTLGIGEELISEDEARRRREQLNRRPSYRMILKDLETVGDKPMKKELDDSAHAGERAPSGGGNMSLGGHPNAVQNNLNASPYGSPPSTTPHLNGASARDGVQRPVAVNAQSLSRPPSDGGVGIGSPPRIPGMLPAGGGAVLRTASADIPSQPQPQLTSTASLLQAAAASAANPLGVLPGVPGDLLNLKPVNEPISLATAGAPFSAGNDWQTSLLQQYNPNHSPLTGTSNLGNRQASASLTSLSDNDESSRKRQVRLLKNREAAKECRRKKKEYVKCLENRVAVLENQNKALIEELKTLKELYCRKEKTEM
ncbi:bZIP transcription factor family protein [Aphelenchoides avenae]|nr:bZIP transcription factor family protein [Aphelenchus avenae]